jgi:hypothetical protein
MKGEVQAAERPADRLLTVRDVQGRLDERLCGAAWTDPAARRMLALMGYETYHVAYCGRGHQFAPDPAPAHCPQCGAEYVRSCPECEAAFPGAWESPAQARGIPAWLPPKRPDCCQECGAPYPWGTTTRRTARGLWTRIVRFWDRHVLPIFARR